MKRRSESPMILIGQPSEKPNKILDSAETELDYIYKLLVLGGKGCGLTSFFSNDSINSIEKDRFYISKVYVLQKLIKLQIRTQITDLRSSRPDALIVLFDLTNVGSFERAKEIIRQQAGGCGQKNIILVGTKADLGKERVVDQESIRGFLQNSLYTADVFIETSSATGTNITTVFEKTAELILTQRSQPSPKKDPNRIELQDALRKYIKRIESYTPKDSTKINFCYFWFPFYKESRGFNRHANYQLAVNLLESLVQGESISSTFEDLETKRDDIFNELLKTSPIYTKRKINSAELNKIIDRAKELSRCEASLDRSENSI